MTNRPFDQWDYKINDVLIGADDPPDNNLLDADGSVIQRPENKSVEALPAISGTTFKTWRDHAE